MKNTNPIFSLKNFRSFGEEGADFELAPITVLTGCNSAGKSSLVKALLLLSHVTEKKENDFLLEPFHSTVINDVRADDLLVSAKELCLGNYGKIINRNSKDGLIELSYTVWSPSLKETVGVTRIYKEDPDDTLQNGQLVGLYIKKVDGTLIYGKGIGISNSYSQLISEDECFNRDCIQDAISRLDVLSEYFSKREKLDNAKRRLETFKRRVEKFEGNSEVLQREQNSYDKAELEFNEAKKKIEESSISQEEFKRIEKVYLVDRGDISIAEMAKLEEVYLADPEWGCSNECLKTIWRWVANVKSNTVFPGDFGLKDWGYSISDKEFLNILAEEALNPTFAKDVKYINSSSAIINRLYLVEGDDKLNVALKLFLQRKKSFRNGRPDMPGVERIFPGQFISRWIKKFGIGDKVKIVGTDEGLGVMVYLYKNGEKSLLADEGYGITQLFSLLLHIDNMMLENGRTYNICIEEPEVHLHPKYQSMLADLFVEAYQKYNIHFIIETHSEYLIRKLQVMVANKEIALTPGDVSLNYVEKDENGVSTNRKIEIQDDGRLSGCFGTGFFDEADNRAMELLHLKATQK